MHHPLFLVDLENSFIAHVATFVFRSLHAQLLGDEMAGKQEGYTVSVDGPDHKFKRSIDEATAISILNLVTSGALPGSGTRVVPGALGSIPGTPFGGAGSAPGQTIKQFVTTKRPETQYERVACLAYYLTHVSNTP